MTCPNCGALGGAADTHCRGCGHALAEEEITVVLRPRSGAANRTAQASAPATLPPLGPAPAPLVISSTAVAPVQAAAPPTAAHPWAPPTGAPAPPAPWRPAGPPQLPPPPSSPAALPAGPDGAAPRTPWRGWPAVAAGGLLVVAVGAGAAFFLLRGNDDTTIAGGALQGGQVSVASIAGSATNATKLVTLRAVGRRSATAETDLVRASQSLGQIGDAKLRARAQAAVDAQRAYLHAMAGLTGLGVDQVDATGYPTWATARRGATAAVGDIKATQAALAKDELPGKTTVDTAAVQKGTAAVDGLVTKDHGLLASWHSRLNAYNSRVTANRRHAGVVTTYRVNVQKVLDAYDADRDRVTAFTRRVDDMEPEDAMAAIDGFQQDRQRTMQQLGLLEPDDAETRGAVQRHDGLSVPVSNSQDGLSAAAEAVSESTDDSPPTEQPEWASFQATSREVDGTLATAESLWNQKVSSLYQAALTRGLGQKPAKPSL